MSNSDAYMTAGKTIALTRQTFVSKVMSLPFNMLSRLVIAFLPRSKCYFMTAVTICLDSGAPEIKSAIVSTISAKHGIIHRTFPHRGNYLAQNVSSAKVEKF